MGAKLLPLRRTSGDSAALSDEALVAACSARDTTALAALFDRHHKDVHRFLVRLAGVDDDVVDDLLQDTFLEVWEGAARFRSGSRVRTWIFGIAANLGRQHVRTDHRRKARAAVYLERLPEGASTPGDALERRQQLERLAATLDELPHDLKVAWILCDLEEERGVDAARALGVREGTLYRRLHEARRALRAGLGEG